LSTTLTNLNDTDAMVEICNLTYQRVYRHTVILSRDLRIVFFSFESNLESNRPSDSFSNRIFESNRPYTTQVVTQPNGLQAYHTACYRPIICWRLALWTCVLYLIHRYFVFMTIESDVRPTELRTEYLFISIQS